MAHFYFDIRNSFGFTPDDEGRDLADEQAARDEALKGARSLLSAEVLQGRLNLRGWIEITDEQRQAVAVITFDEAVRVLKGELPVDRENGEQA